MRLSLFRKKDRTKKPSDIDNSVELVKKDMIQWQGKDCGHTVIITLWQDGDYQIECRHGCAPNWNTHKIVVHSTWFIDGHIIRKTELVDMIGHRRNFRPNHLKTK